VGRSRSRLERVRALDPGLVDVVALEELPEDWAEKRLLAGAIRSLAPDGAQAIVDYLGDGQLAAAAALGMRNGGTVVLIGAGPEPLGLPTGLLMASGFRVVGSRSCTRRDAREVLELLRSGRLAIDDLLTHRVSLPDVNEAVDELTGRAQGAWLITVDVGTPATGAPAAEEVVSR
jgi:threonine dehydrogenase-like Zn-dependent dehydrogenase